MNNKTFVQMPGGVALPQEVAGDHIQAHQRNQMLSMIRIQVSGEVMGKLVSVVYMEGLNTAKMMKMAEIKNTLKDEEGYTDEIELERKAMEEFNKQGQNINVVINVGMCADIAVKSAEALIQRLGL